MHPVDTLRLLSRGLMNWIQYSGLGSWILRKPVPLSLIKSDSVRINANSLGYVWDEVNKIYRHEDEIFTTPPTFGSYWISDRYTSLGSDLKNIGCSILRIPNDTPDLVGGVGRSADRWILRNSFGVNFDNMLFGCIKEILIKQNNSNNLKRLLDNVMDLYHVMTQSNKPYDYAIYSPLKEVLASLIENICYSQIAKHHVFDSLQPILALSDFRMTSHGVAKPFCMYDSDSMQLLIDTTSAFMGDCESFGFDVCLGFGNALGLYRENRFLDHDCDVDIIVGYKSSPHDNHKALRDKLFGLLESKGWRCKLFGNYDDDVPNFYVERLEAVHDGRPDFSGLEPNLIFDTSNLSDIKLSPLRGVLGWDQLFPAREFIFSDGILKVPNDIKGYLEAQYGVSWAIPKPYSLTWDF